MKKDDKQPKKPKKKPQSRAAKQPVKKPKTDNVKPAEITLPVKQTPSEATPAHVFRDRRIARQEKYDLNLDDEKYRTGLSISEWQELLKKDPSLLTPRQAKQLEQANEMAIEMARRISAQYDFSGIAKSLRTLETLPLARITQQVQQLAIGTQKLQSSFIMPVQQMALAQQKLAMTAGIANQSFIALANAANISRSFFESINSMSEMIVKALSIDLASIGTSLAKFTAVESINLNDIEVIDRDGNVTVISDTNRTKQISDDYVYVSNAKLDLILTKIEANNDRISEVERLVTGQLPAGTTNITYADAKFQIESSKLILKGYEVDVQRSSKQARFCDFFFNSVENFTKKWDVTVIMERIFTMHVGTDGNEDTFNNIIKGYVKALNIKIAAATKGQITDFFVLLHYEVYINPKYLSNL